MHLDRKDLSTSITPTIVLAPSIRDTIAFQRYVFIHQLSKDTQAYACGPLEAWKWKCSKPDKLTSVPRACWKVIIDIDIPNVDLSFLVKHWTIAPLIPTKQKNLTPFIVCIQGKHITLDILKLLLSLHIYQLDLTRCSDLPISLLFDFIRKHKKELTSLTVLQWNGIIPPTTISLLLPSLRYLVLHNINCTLYASALKSLRPACKGAILVLMYPIGLTHGLIYELRQRWDGIKGVIVQYALGILPKDYWEKRVYQPEFIWPSHTPYAPLEDLTQSYQIGIDLDKFSFNKN